MLRSGPPEKLMAFRPIRNSYYIMLIFFLLYYVNFVGFPPPPDVAEGVLQT